MFQTAHRGRRLTRFLAIASLIAAGGFLSAAHAGLITGKGKAAGLCYLAYDVEGSESTTAPKPGIVQCTDGDPCDTGPCGDNKCDFKVAACINQASISGCTPPSGGLKKAQVKGKIKIQVPQLLTSSTCGAILDAAVGPVKFKKNGQPKSPGYAKSQKFQAVTQVATKGVKPKSGNNNIQFRCLPRAGAPASCPVPTTTTTTTLPPSCDTPCTNPAISKLSFETTTGTTDCGSAGLYKHCKSGAVGLGNGVCNSDADCLVCSDFTGTDDFYSCTTSTDCTGGGTCGPKAGDCGGTPPNPPFSGETRAGNAAKLADLGNSCLYLGGGDQIGTPPSANPDGSFLQMNACCPTGSNAAATLLASAGTSKLDCTKGAGPSKKCQNGSLGTDGQGACTQDTDCGAPQNGGGSCAPVANCFFGPPLPIASPVLSTCVLNVISADASGNLDATTGNATMTLPLSSRVYLTGNSTSPCPKCINNGTSNVCDPNWRSAGGAVGANSGQACTPVGSKLTSQDCLPNLNGFVGPIPVSLTNITTGSSTITADASGNFCPNQTVLGGFGSVYTRSIIERGSPAGALLDFADHQGKLGGGFCVPASGNAAIDGSASLPGPGATSLPGKFKLLP